MSFIFVKYSEINTKENPLPAWDETADCKAGIHDVFPKKHETLPPCWADVGQASKTMGQRQPNASCLFGPLINDVIESLK